MYVRAEEEDPSGDSQDYVQENMARGQKRNVVTAGNDRYGRAIVG